MFVHIVMYSYYYFASQRPLIKKNLWWKQYVTILQMAQFVIIFAHSAWTLTQTKCQVSRQLIYMVVFMSVIMFSMFCNFFFCAYIMPKRKSVVNKLK